MGRSDRRARSGAILIFTTCGTVEKALFSITCTTCQARLAVRSRDVIGAILECPKCGSMVQVIPPAGRVDESQQGRNHAGSVEKTATPVAATADLATGKAASSADSNEPASGETAFAEAVEGGKPDGQSASTVGVDAELLGPVRVGASPAEMLWRKWLVLATAPVAGLVAAAGVWSMFFSSSRPELPPVPAVRQAAQPSPPEQPTLPEEEPESLPSAFDRRWIPNQTRLLVSLHSGPLAGQPGLGKAIDLAGPAWQLSAGTMLRGLGLNLRVISRLTWAATDLAAWPEQSVAVIELDPSQDAHLLATTGEAVDLGLPGTDCRRRPSSDWPHPYAILDRRTIVTGDAELLRGLARRSEAELESRPMAQLIETTMADVDLTVLIDLAAARKADWQLPGAVLDVWPSGSQPWHVIWEVPEGLGCTWKTSDRPQSEVALVCEGETAADQVQAAVGQLIEAAGESLMARLESLPEQLQSGQLTTAAANQYELLLNEGLHLARSAQLEVVGRTVWVRMDGNQGPSSLAVATVDSQPAIEADWLAAARRVDEANHGRLLAGLGGYAKSQHHFPSATAGGSLLSPETRLSWIATMLPYLGHADWHRQLEPGYKWNGSENREVARQPLPEVINPAMGPSKTEANFPVTHYVGVAGIGPDAGKLPVDDPRAGIFGFGRSTRPEDIADGAAHTIAVLGVAKSPGPWAAGGRSTIRALTERPYVNGPDGFGSGQPDGMLAGMADGSVRFISKNIDPAVLEQLATINGRENVTVAALDPKPDSGGPDAEPPADRTREPNDKQPAAEPEANVPPKVALSQIDVKARLADEIPEIQFKETPLGEAVAFLSAMSTLPITFDADTMVRLGITLHDPVTVELSEANVGRILQEVAARRGLVVVVENGQVLLTSPAAQREKLWHRPYSVSDLTGNAASGMAELAEMVEQLVSPDSWRSNGGRGTIEPQGGSLKVVQTAVVHHQILVFCEKLRNARGKPLLSRLNPELFTLTTRRDRAHEKLSQPVTVNFLEPTPLIEVLGLLGAITETDFLVDRLALAAAGISDTTGATLKAQKQPLATVLEELLEPLGLAYRVIDDRTIQVATRKAVAARLELEFFHVADLSANDLSPPALAERISRELAESPVRQAQWSDSGGSGVLHIDAPSGCLIVLQSQPVQAAIQRFLAQLREEQGIKVGLQR